MFYCVSTFYYCANKYSFIHSFIHVIIITTAQVSRHGVTVGSHSTLFCTHHMNYTIFHNDFVTTTTPKPSSYHPHNTDHPMCLPLVTTSSMVDAVSEAMKPIVANMTNPARNAVHVSNIDIITASLRYNHTSTQRHITVSNIDIITASLRYNQTSTQRHITVSATHLSTNSTNTAHTSANAKLRKNAPQSFTDFLWDRPRM